MNRGAFVFEKSFLTGEELATAVELADGIAAQRTPVHEAGKYSNLRWFQVKIDPEWPVAAKLLSRLCVSEPEMLVFYYLEAGAVLHPHRDLTGASLNDRVRFHVPIKTNDGVEFIVHGEKIKMLPGELWCLDTSYKHSVKNEGSETRIHLIVECKISTPVRAAMPRDLPAKLHNVFYILLLGGKLAQSLVINIFKDPAYFRNQMAMISKFVGWRFLGRGVK